jgi:hypothetical protein
LAFKLVGRAGLIVRLGYKIGAYTIDSKDSAVIVWVGRGGRAGRVERAGGGGGGPIVLFTIA